MPKVYSQKTKDLAKWVKHESKVCFHAYKGFEIPPQFDALNQYMDRHLSSAMLGKLSPSESMVRWGWANARADMVAADEAAAELAPRRSRRSAVGAAEQAK